MGYEYKEKIKEDLKYSLESVPIDYYSSEVLIHKQKVKELDHVYAQASKADEYEAKAKAFDEIMREWENGRTTKSQTLDTMQKFYDHFESGESGE